MPVTRPDHRFKVWPEFFEPIKAGRCLFYACPDNSARFRIGDVIELESWDDNNRPTGHACKRRVTYVLVGGGGGSIPPISTIARGYSVVSLSPKEVP